FCDPQPSRRQGPVLWEFRLKGDSAVRQRSPKNVGRIGDYYSVPKDGAMDPAVETALSKIESGAAPVIAKLRAGDIAISDDERVWLAAFIALQMVRGPAFRDHVESFVGTVGTAMLRAMARSPEYRAELLRRFPGALEDGTPKAEALANMMADPSRHFVVTGTPQS